MGQEAMLKACRHAFWMGYMGTSAIHPGWVKPANQGFAPPESEVALARKVKSALDEAYARGEGSVSVDDKMYDVANMKHVGYLLARAEAIEKRDTEKAAAVEAAGGEVEVTICEKDWRGLRSWSSAVQPPCRVPACSWGVGGLRSFMWNRSAGETWRAL